MFSEAKRLLEHFVEISRKRCDRYHVVCVANVKGLTSLRSNYATSPVETEFFSQSQMRDIEFALEESGYSFTVYNDEDMFIADVETGVAPFDGRKILVMNFAQKGTGLARKSLIPAFCDMKELTYAGSNAFASSLCRHKSVWHGMLRELGYPVCDYWTFDPLIGWVNKAPEDGTRIIVKIDGETSSIGLESGSSILTYSPSCDRMLRATSKHYGRRLHVETFVSGKEVEIPLINHQGRSTCLGVAGISYQGKHLLDDVVLDYDIRGKNKFAFYNFEIDNPDLAAILARTAESISLACNLDGYCRVDFRIDKSGNYFATDISSSPHLTKSMTYAFLLNEENMPYEIIYEALIGQAIANIEGETLA